MKRELVDPQGFHHVIEFHGGQWWGTENLAHGEVLGMRGVVMNQVIRAVANNLPMPHGFRLVGLAMMGLAGAGLA